MTEGTGGDIEDNFHDERLLCFDYMFRSAAPVADCSTDQIPTGKAGFVSHSAQYCSSFVANSLCLCILYDCFMEVY